MAQKKSAEFIPKIIKASTPKEAVDILKEIVQELHLTSSYVDLVELKDKLEIKKKEYKLLAEEYADLELPMTYEATHTIRTGLNFLYRDISDEFSFKISQLKIYFEERKTVQRANSSMALKNNEQFKKDFGNKKETPSESAIRDYVGFDSGYDEWTSCYSTAYGLNKELESLLNSIRMLIDSCASEERFALMILQQDAK